MSTSRSLRQAGLHTYTDDAQIIHHRYSPKARECSRRFGRFRSRVAKKSHSTAGLYAARLVALCMVIPSQIESAAIALPYRYCSNPMIEWKHSIDSPLDRRRLCSLTFLSWQASTAKSNPMERLLELLLVDKDYMHFAKNKAIDQLELDFCHWASRNLSGPLYAHVCGLAPIHPVSRETLARLELKAVKMGTTVVDQEYEIAVAEFQEAAGEATIDDDTDAEIRYAIDLLVIDKNLTEEEQLKKWILQIAARRDQVRESSINTAVILCSMIDLLESGTLRSPDAPLETRLRYIRKAPLHIHRAFRAMGVAIDKANEDQLKAVYLSVIENPNIGDRRAVAAVVSFFKQYTESVWGIPEVTLHTTSHIPPPKPRVQIVHPHELNFCLASLAAQEGGDQYALRIASLELRLLCLFPTRADELRYTRLCNLSFNEAKTKAELELYPAAGRRFKNKGSVRRAEYYDAETISLLQEWKKMRLDAGATLDDYLFGFEDLPGIYRASTITAIQRICLKVATGDMNMTIHALRHTASTSDFVAGKSVDLLNTNRYFHQCERKGHNAPPMGFEFYIHRFEDQLFEELRKCNLRDVKYSSSDAATLILKKAGSIRTKSSRLNGGGAAEIIWSELDQMAQAIQIEPVADQSEWHVPATPQLTSVGAVSLSPMLVHRVISLAILKSPQEISIVHSIPLKMVQSICSEVIAYGRNEYLKLSPSKRAGKVPVSNLMEAMDHLGFKMDYGRQRKYASLRLSLSNSIHVDLAGLIASIFPDIVKSRIYIRLDYSHLTTKLLEAMRAFSVSTTVLLVRFQPCRSQPSKLNSLIAQAHAHFQSLWNEVPPFDEDEFDHDSRPDAYLLWPARPSDHSPRSVEVNGLIALLFCTTIYHRLKGPIHAAS